MLIGGLLKITLIDYPGKAAAIVFTQGCNLKCFFCHNPELVDKKLFSPPLKEEEVFAFLKERQGLLDGVCISGGEPLLQRDIMSFLRKIKELGFMIKIDTNGTRPHILEEIIQKKLTDYLAMDIKASLERYEEIGGVSINLEKIKKSVKIIMESGLDYEFRTTLLPQFHNEEEIKKIVQIIKGAKKYYLQNFTNQGKVLNQEKAGKKGFNKEEMKKFLKIALKQVQNCQIRI